MASIKRLVIVQPANKTLIAINGKGEPLNLLTAGDIVRGNASEPSNGNISYLFTSATEVSVDKEPSVSVTTDGVTYNDDVGGKGVDLIFRPKRSSGDNLSINVTDAVDAKDNYLSSTGFNDDRNFGTCLDLRAGNTNPRSSVFLIKFDIPDAVKNVDNIVDVTAFFFKHAGIGSASEKLEMHIISEANSAWTEGARCNSQGINESTWSKKRFFQGDPGNGDNWVESVGQGPGVESPLLSNPAAGDVGSWIAFTDNSGNFKNYLDRMIRGNNVGLRIWTERNDAITVVFRVRSSEYTTDITQRPKMNFIYEQEISGLDAMSFSHNDSMGEELGGYASTRYSSSFQEDGFRSDTKRENDINDDYGKNLLGGQ